VLSLGFVKDKLAYAKVMLGLSFANAKAITKRGIFRCFFAPNHCPQRLFFDKRLIFAKINYGTIGISAEVIPLIFFLPRPRCFDMVLDGGG
jgi:hypothetical protein